MGIEISIKNNNSSLMEDEKDLLSVVLKKISRIDKLLKDHSIEAERRAKLCETQREYMKQYLKILRSR